MSQQPKAERPGFTQADVKRARDYIRRGADEDVPERVALYMQSPLEMSPLQDLVEVACSSLMGVSRYNSEFFDQRVREVRERAMVAIQSGVLSGSDREPYSTSFRAWSIWLRKREWRLVDTTWMRSIFAELDRIVDGSAILAGEVKTTGNPKAVTTSGDDEDWLTFTATWKLLKKETGYIFPDKPDSFYKSKINNAAKKCPRYSRGFQSTRRIHRLLVADLSTSADTQDNEDNIH